MHGGLLSAGRGDGEGEDWSPKFVYGAKKLELLTLQATVCLRGSLGDCSSSSLQLQFNKQHLIFIIIIQYSTFK